MYKVVQKSKDGSVLSLQEIGKTEVLLCEVAEHSKAFTGRINVGSTVNATIKPQNGVDTITWIQVVKDDSEPKSSGEKYTKGNFKPKTNSFNDPKEQERKNKQGVLTNAVNLVSNLGYSKNDNIDDVLEVVEKVFDTLLKKVSNDSFTTVTENTETKKETSQEDGLYIPENAEEITDIDESEGLQVID